MIDNLDHAEFRECAECATKTGSPVLCPACLHNRELVHDLQVARRNAESAAQVAEAERRNASGLPSDEMLDKLQRMIDRQQKNEVTLRPTAVSIPMSAIMPQRILSVLSEKLPFGHAIHCFSCADLEEFAVFMTDEERETLSRTFMLSGARAVSHVEILGLAKRCEFLERDARVLSMGDVENAIIDSIECEAEDYQSYDWPPVNAGLDRLKKLARERVGKS